MYPSRFDCEPVLQQILGGASLDRPVASVVSDQNVAASLRSFARSSIALLGTA